MSEKTKSKNTENTNEFLEIIMKQQKEILDALKNDKVDIESLKNNFNIYNNIIPLLIQNLFTIISMFAMLNEQIDSSMVLRNAISADGRKSLEELLIKCVENNEKIKSNAKEKK